MTLLELELNNQIKQLKEENSYLKKQLLLEMRNTEKEKLKNKALCNKIANFNMHNIAVLHLN